MNVLLLCRKFKKDKSMKKGRFSLLGIVALFLGLILVSCSDDDDHNTSNNVHANSYYDNESCHKKACNMLIPVLYLSLLIRDPNHVDDNVYNNHRHPAYAYRKFWLFQEPNRHSPNFFRTACNNHPMNYWTYYILHINAFDNLIAPLRHIYLPCL